MIDECPHCKSSLQFNPAQHDKIRTALAAIKSGPLKLGCPHCKKPIALGPDGELYKEPLSESTSLSSRAPQAITVTPPAYPDISWLAQGIYTEREVVHDVPKALILMASGQDRDTVAKALAERGYQIEIPESANDALVKMRFSSFAAIVLHADFERSSAETTFHQQMTVMPMQKRRSLFYALIGKDVHTLYNLEALVHSANVVINDTEIPHFDIILKKGLQEMQELFGPYTEALNRTVVH
ncbi:MAG: hypothetical protein PHI06_08295 [Desulfobulbaceae bacterium]|nr:hypothetical protein [Desulfobulbaceae bacterium]